MASATITNTQTEQDEHLAKFPPFKGPKTGGNFEVDENVVAALPVPGTEVVLANTYGNSLWGRTAKIICRTPDGASVSYFHKAITHEMSGHMIEADFEPLKALHNMSPAFAPKPYSWGPYKSDPSCHFMLAEFREVGQQPPEPVRFTARLAELHRNSVSPTGKFGFHMKTMAGPIQQHNDGWSDSWEEIFGNFLGHLLDLDGEKNEPWPEFEHIKYITKARVIPRLLRPLQSHGRSIKPCLVHGDLWDGNSATNLIQQEVAPIGFEPYQQYGMSVPEQSPPQFSPVRACIFDMDGLLLNTEDIYKQCADNILTKYGRPPLPWSIKAKLMGVPGSSNGDIFHDWAQLPISREKFEKEQNEQQELHFPDCTPLPGAKELLTHLKSVKNKDGYRVEIALATSSEKYNYNRKASRAETRKFLDLIPEDRRIYGDDDRVQQGRGKPAPDIYMLALEIINSTLPGGQPKITPKECLVFEDSVPGVEAGRRAGMRVVWVPHPELAVEYEGREKEVLAGRTGLVEIGDEDQLGQLDDGWAEQLSSLEAFPYAQFGITGL